MTRTAHWLIAAVLVWMGPSAQAQDHPLLWQVKGAQATDYLLGSVHLQPQDATRLPPSIETAYRQVRGLVFETDIGALETAGLQQQFIARGHTQNGETLAGEVGADLATATRARLNALGASETLCDTLRAWFCGTFIEVFSFTKQGFSGEEGIDHELHTLAVADHKPERGLETPAQQLELLAGLPPDAARDFLKSCLEDDDPDESPQAMYQAWRSGDEAALAKMDAEMRAQYPKLYDRLLAARNRAWMPTLQAILAQPQSEMIVTGALHWVGPDGLVAALRARGYVVTAVIDPPQSSDLTSASVAREP